MNLVSTVAPFYGFDDQVRVQNLQVCWCRMGDMSEALICVLQLDRLTIYGIAGELVIFRFEFFLCLSKPQAQSVAITNIVILC